MKSATRKARKRPPKFEVAICECGNADFKFVLASDVDHLRNSIVCSACVRPIKNPATLNTIIELAGKSLG